MNAYKYLTTVRSALILAALIVAPVAQAADRCHDMAAMYRLAYQMRDLGLTDSSLISHTKIYEGFTDFERSIAVNRVKISGDLGQFSGATVYKHVYLECKVAK